MLRLILLLGMLIAAMGVAGQEHEPAPLLPYVFEIVLTQGDCMDRQIDAAHISGMKALRHQKILLLMCRMMSIPSPDGETIVFLNVDHCIFYWNRFSLLIHQLTRDVGEPLDLSNLNWAADAICGADSGEE